MPRRRRQSPRSTAGMWADERWQSTKPVQKQIGPPAVADVVPADGIASTVKLPSRFPTVKYLLRVAAEAVRGSVPYAASMAHPICLALWIREKSCNELFQ